MGKGSIEKREPSRATYEALEELVRFKVQEFIQDILEERSVVVLRKRQIGTTGRHRQGGWISKWIRTTTASVTDEWDNSGAASEGSRYGETI